MSTANFISVKTDRIYAFGFEDDYGIEDSILNASSELAEKGWDEYKGSPFAKKSIERISGNVVITTEMVAKYEYGYYNGACFDYDVSYYVYTSDGYTYEYDDTCDIENCVIEDNWYNNQGLSKIQAKNIEKLIESDVEILKREAENAFANYCEYKLICVARFNNGEAWYEEVKN